MTSIEAPEEMDARWKKAIAEAGVPTEQEMRAAEVPWMDKAEELAAYISALVDRPHDYGTCVYAMSMAAVAAFRYVAGQLGTTGFQTSCADLDVIRRTRALKMGFLILKAEDLLYPQYDLRAALEKFIEDEQPELAKQAAKLLAEIPAEQVHPDVRAHWERLAGATPTTRPRRPKKRRPARRRRTMKRSNGEGR